MQWPWKHKLPPLEIGQQRRLDATAARLEAAIDQLEGAYRHIEPYMSQPREDDERRGRT